MTLAAIWPWIAFNVAVVAVLALDLGVFHRTPHAVSLREAMVWSVIWILLAVVFNGVVLLWKGQEPALQFLAGYLIDIDRETLLAGHGATLPAASRPVRPFAPAGHRSGPQDDFRLAAAPG